MRRLHWKLPLTLLAAGAVGLALLPGRQGALTRSATAIEVPDVAREHLPAPEVAAPTPASRQAEVPRLAMTMDATLVAAPGSSVSAPLELAPPPPLEVPLRTDRVGEIAVNVRTAPDVSSRKIGVAAAGESVGVLEERGGWVRIVRAEGDTGWVYGDYLGARAAAREARLSDEAESPAAASERSGRLAKAVVVRAAPDRSSPGLFRLQRGERVVVAEARGGWIRVVAANGVSGWIYSPGSL